MNHVVEACQSRLTVALLTQLEEFEKSGKLLG
jgi:hypothetical protein